jgi:hypothetical protein
MILKTCVFVIKYEYQYPLGCHIYKWIEVCQHFGGMYCLNLWSLKSNLSKKNVLCFGKISVTVNQSIDYNISVL